MSSTDVPIPEEKTKEYCSNCGDELVWDEVQHGAWIHKHGESRCRLWAKKDRRTRK
jgi:hypothetical protein